MWSKRRLKHKEEENILKMTLYMKTPKLSKRPPKTNKTNTGTNKSLWLDNHRKKTWCKTGDVGKSKETSIKDKNEKEKKPAQITEWKRQDD